MSGVRGRGGGRRGCGRRMSIFFEGFSEHFGEESKRFIKSVKGRGGEGFKNERKRNNYINKQRNQ